MDEDASADAIWAALKAARAALLAAGAKGARVKALDALVALVAEVAAARGRLLHKWRAWGWLLLAVQLAVQRDAQELLALPDALPDPEAAAAAVGQKRKRAKSATARLAPPRLELWSALLMQLEALHAAGAQPSLHLDGNGRSLLERLFSYSAAVISRVRSSDAEFERMAAPLDAFAWRSVAFVAQFRVYCAVIPHDALQTVLEFALSALDDGDRDRFDRTGVDTRNAHALRANFVRLAVKNYPFDLHDGLPVLVECLTGWFHLVRPENVANTVWNVGSMASGETVHRVATVVLDALASLCKRYHSCIGPLLLTAPNLLDVLHFIQRTWRTYKIDTHGSQLQFIAQFIQLYRYNAGDGLTAHGVERMDVCRELNGLARALLDTKELVDLATARKVSGRGTPFSSKAPGSTALDVHMHTEDMTMLHLVCSADVIHLHDQIASAIVSDRADSVDASGVSTASQSLRVRLLWERIVDNACQAVRISSSEIISGAPTFFPIASDGRDYGSAAGKLPELSGENVVRVGATWMLVLLALLSRHGDFYVSTRIADIMTLLTEFGESLVTKEIRQTQYYAVLTLIQLADLHAKNRKACSDLLDELWVNVWHTLLRPDLPYSRVTGETQLWRESAGDAVLTLLNFMIASPLVSGSVMVSSAQALWCLPAFQKGVGNASIIGRKQPSSTSVPRSMMATILLTTMLNCVQLPDQPNSPLLSSQLIPSSTELSVYSVDDTKTKQRLDIPTRSELLKTVFDDLRAFATRETPTDRSVSIEFTSREEHVPVAVATLFGAFLCHDELRTLPSVRVFLPTVLRRLEAPIRFDLGNTPDTELSGFGIPFGLSEEGLNFLMSDNGVTSRSNPNCFSTVTTKAQALLPCNTKPMTTAKVVTHTSSFERLNIPPSLLNVLSPHEKDTSLEPWITSPRVITASISDATKSQLQAEIANEFSVILNELSSQISRAKANPHQVVSHLINLQQIGLILALLFMNSSTTRDTTSNSSSSQIVLLMKTVLEIFTAAFSPGAITRARLSLKTAPLLVQVFVKFYSFILTLQSPNELALCNHPSSVPKNFRILPELRPAIRQVVAVVEESLALATEDVPTSSSEGDRRGRHPAELSAVRSSVSTGGHRANAMDVESNAADKCELYLSDPIQMAINLWCFRVVLLLKKEAGLEVIKRHAGNLQLSPDFMLALSVITTGIPAADSVDIFARLVHHSVTEAAGESKRMQWYHSFSGSFFITQVLYALALAAEAHEIRKAQHPEDLPVSLVECAKKYLDMSVSHPLRLFVPHLRAAEVRCLEVFFRLNPDAFPDFENAPLDGILDASFVVRVQSARALQTLLYMFPDGQASICGEIANRLNGNSPEETRVKPRATNKTIEMCCTDALCWFICAGVFEDVIPNALDFYVRMASDSRRAMESSTLKSWISAIADTYDYSSSVALVNDHFGFLWWSFLSRQFAALNRAAAKGKSEALSISQLIDKFPFGALDYVDQANQRTNRGGLDHFVEKMDVIFPLTVLASSIEGSSSLEETEVFSLVHELAKLVAEAQDMSDEIECTSAVNTQLPLDLVAFSLIFKASGLKDLQVLADKQLKDAMPERISTTAYGQIIGKFTQFVVMGLTDPRWLPWGQHHEDEDENDSVFLEGGALWAEGIACMKNVFEGFHWQLRDLSALFGRFYLLLLQSSHFTPCAERAVDCFQHFARCVMPLMDKNAVLQRLVLVICFQAIKQLTRRPRKRVARSLTFLVRELCETFMKTTDTFGRYLSLVVEEIGDILMVCGCSSDQTRLKKHLYLDEDDQGHLEWVVFAICNDMASLGKFAQDVHAVPKGVSTCLDKLDSILDASRSTLADDEGAPMKYHDAEVFASAPPSSIQASEYLRKFIEWESNSEARFYRSRGVFGSTSRVEGFPPAPARPMSGLHQRLSSEVVRLSKVSSSIHTLRQSSRPQDHAELVRSAGKLAHVLLYRSWRDANHSASEHPHDSVLISIADALGDVGALDSHEFELSPGADVRELSRLFQYRFQRGALCETSPSFLTLMHEQVVAWLSSLLFEQRQARANVISEALIALRRIQGTNEGLWAHSQSKDKDLRQFLSEFYAETTADWSASIGISSEWPMFTVTRTTLSDLWRQSTSMDFQAWICAISATLAEETPDLILQSCRSLMTMRADLAVFAFPYLVWTIFDAELDSNESPDVANAANRLRQVRADINDGVGWIVKEAGRDYLAENGVVALDGASAPRAEVVQTVLHAINFLRETEKVKFISTVRAPTKTKGKATSGSQTPQQKPSYGCILDVDLLDIARAAVSVKMPFSAMQYVEMWIEHTYGEVLPLSHPVFDNEASSAEFRQVLVEAYKHDSNIDGVYGVSDGRTFGSQLVTYSQEGDYSRTLPLFDVMLQFSGGSSIRAQEGMLLSLQKLGYNHLLEGYMASVGQAVSSGNTSRLSTSSLDYKYERAWKNMQWNAVITDIESGSESLHASDLHQPVYSHQKMLFESLKAIVHRDFKTLSNITSEAKMQILQTLQLSLSGLETTQESYRALGYLQSIREIEEVAVAMEGNQRRVFDAPRTGFGSSSATPVSLDMSTFLESWQQRHTQVRKDFDTIDNLLAVEEVLIKTADPSPESASALSKLYLSLAARGRKAKRVAIAYSALLRLEQLKDRNLLNVFEVLQWKMQRAKLLWSQQEGRSAIWTAKQVSIEVDSYLQQPLTATDLSDLMLLQINVLTVTGKWIAAQRSESSQVIIDEYFKRATNLVEAMDAASFADRISQAAKAHLALAEYMGEMHQQVNARIKSREWLAGKKVAEARSKELAACKAMRQELQDANRMHILGLEREVEHDKAERASVEQSVDLFLIGALSHYGKGLGMSTRGELATVFKVVSLWFANYSNETVDATMKDLIETVPSYKFVPLSYQIISRIGSGVTMSGDGESSPKVTQDALSELVLKLCQQHPHHTLIQLIALKNGSDAAGKNARAFRTNVGDTKSAIARQYLDALRRTDQRELIEAQDTLANLYIQLALLNTEQYQQKNIKDIRLAHVPIINSSVRSSGRERLPNFEQCFRELSRRGGNRDSLPAILTLTIPPRADMDYSRVVRIQSFASTFSITDSGLHRPKILHCSGSNGLRYKQLVKGLDDTRQDLVIEQVFETVNQFLKESEQTRKRKLRLVTYRVVPLSPAAGVLEWVDKTMPFGDYLVTRSSKKMGAHERYHPHEWRHAACRSHLKAAPDKLKAYKQIEARFTPVFHHFFLEKFPDPATWYSRRLAYVRSVAVTSIVGYILGIGDRHAQNILMHEETAEFVHIDFGVVFDQGMALLTPETVPFRLTRDMVDGMGVSGCDGVFSRCCEATLQLLRAKAASVVTILEVFVHDPLYRWMLSPLKALRLQKDDQGGIDNGLNASGDQQDEEEEDGASNDAAARALLRVRQKLEGFEDPNGNALSIEGQVKHLISEAQDPRNLCRLFPGWAPWI